VVLGSVGYLHLIMLVMHTGPCRTWRFLSGQGVCGER
jgi:hypothetical protein